MESEKVSQLENDAKFLHTIFSFLKPLIKLEYVKYLLGLYYIQLKKSNNEKWDGASKRAIVEISGEVYRGSKHKHLDDNFFMKLGHGWFLKPVSGRHLYKLTNDAFTTIENLLKNSSEIFSLFKTPIPLEVFQSFLARLDSLYYTMRAVNIIGLKDENKEISLYTISSLLLMTPYMFIEKVSQYCIFTGENEIEKSFNEDNKYIYIKIGKPLKERYLLHCGDEFSCNIFCRRCHNTKLELTSLGRKLSNDLLFNQPSLTSQIKLGIIDQTIFIVISVLILEYLLFYYLNKEWFFSSIPFIVIFILGIYFYRKLSYRFVKSNMKE